MANESIIPDDDTDKEAFWSRHIEAWQGSGLSQREYARRHGLPIARFSYWKGKLHPGSRATGFVELKVESGAPVRIQHPSGAVIECMPGTNIRWLRQLLGIDDAS